MTQPLYLTNARIVLADQTLDDGALVVEDGLIASVNPEQRPQFAREINLGGSWLMPGLIDLHSDAVELAAEPRSGVYFPFDHAAAQIDRHVVACGITTFYNAISFAGEEMGPRMPRGGAQLASAIAAYRPHALVDQRVHCRFEVTVARALPDILQLVREQKCHLLSYMDHSPGQGQFATEESYRDYISGRYGYDDATIDELLQRKQRKREDIERDIQSLADAAMAAKLPLAGHDSDSAEQVALMKRIGATISEFPMNIPTAEAGVASGMHHLVGSTNVVRGGSQRSGMKAIELIGNGLADCLCSDYLPSTMLPAIFKIHQERELPLHQAVALATSNPAQAANLSDRGTIDVGKQADLIAVDHVAEMPQVFCTWKSGTPVFTCGKQSRTELTELSSASS